MTRSDFSRTLLALLFIAAGVLHFLKAPFYERIVPPYLGYPRELVFISGIAEVVGGVGVLIPRLRRAAGWGLVLLLIAVFPANLQMAYDALRRSGLSPVSLLLLLRLPLQYVLIRWIVRATQPAPTIGPRIER